MVKTDQFRREEEALKDQLIEIIHNNPALWDLTSADHHKLFNIWEEIYTALLENFGPDQLKAHGADDIKKIKLLWQALRTQYRRIKQGVLRKSGDGAGDCTKVSIVEVLREVVISG